MVDASTENTLLYSNLTAVSDTSTLPTAGAVTGVLSVAHLDGSCSQRLDQ